MRLSYFCLLTFAFCLAVSACNPARPVSISNEQVRPGAPPRELPPTKPVEEMTWTKFNGSNNEDTTVQVFKDLQGKVVILDFWATYCPPCLEEIPHLKELQKRYGKEKLEIVGLHVGGEEDRPKVPAFVEKLKIDYTLATPEDQLTRFIFGKETAIPQTAIFDRKGRLVKKIVGFSEEIKKELDAAVEQTINAGS